MKYEECLLLPPEERRKVAAQEILAKIKDKTLEAERIAFCYAEKDYISVCAVGAFLAYQYDFSLSSIIDRPLGLEYLEYAMKELGFKYTEYCDLHMYFEHEMMGNNRPGTGIRTQNLERVFEFIAATGRIPSVMDHCVEEKVVQ